MGCQDEALLREVRIAQDELTSLRAEGTLAAEAIAHLEDGVERVRDRVSDWDSVARDLRLMMHELREMRARAQLVAVTTAVNGRDDEDFDRWVARMDRLSQEGLRTVEDGYRLQRLLAQGCEQCLDDLCTMKLRGLHQDARLRSVLKKLILVENGLSHRLRTVFAGMGTSAPAAWTDEPLTPVEVSPAAVNEDGAGLLFGR